MHFAEYQRRFSNTGQRPGALGREADYTARSRSHDDVSGIGAVPLAGRDGQRSIWLETETWPASQGKARSGRVLSEPSRFGKIYSCEHSSTFGWHEAARCARPCA